MNGGIQITVLCPNLSTDIIPFSIRKWHFTDTVARISVSHVYWASTFAQALFFVKGTPRQSVLVTIGFPPAEILAKTSVPELAGLDIINCPQKSRAWKHELADEPTASLLESSLFLNVLDPLPVLRKILLRKRIQETLKVRELLTKEELRQYFSLRYQVWKQMNYLPAEQDCPESGCEVNFTDRTAYPLGAFNADGSLMGCARLVFALGYDSPHLKLIEKCVADTGDAKLQKVFRYPGFLTHPFDILESFKGFGDYFQHLVKAKVRYAEVSRVIVAPEQRTQGLGEVLVDSLISLARKKQVKVLFLACNQKLQPFYERCGFKVMPGLSCDSFAGVNAPAIVMTRDVKP